MAPETGRHPISQMKTLWAGLPTPTLTVLGPANLQELDINYITPRQTHKKQQQKKRMLETMKYGFSIMTIPFIKKAER